MKNKNPFRILYRVLNIVALIIFLFGLLSFGYLFIIEGQPYKGLAVLIAFSWATVFIGYFNWANYFYNINYGWTDKDWDRYFQAVQDKQDGLYVPEESLDSPNFNPYRSQSFGFPKGTVRGMIALTLLFGALGMLVASFGMDGNLDQNSFYWDHFEFFKTAFLMMIAFYFGDKSLRYLNKRSNAAREETWLKNRPEGSAPLSELQQDDLEFQDEMGSDETPPDKSVTTAMPVPTILSSQKRALAASENVESPTGMVPIIDAGHGGLDKNGKYVTAPSKMYEFKKNGKIYMTAYEGVINRKIGGFLADLLDEAKIKYYENTLETFKDVPLADRVRFANETYKKDRNAYFLSIHSNAAGVKSPGAGSKARGFEIFTSRGQTKSDDLAAIAAKWYKRELSDFRFRQDMVDGDADKEADFYVLRKTACPAFLVENLFFDNEEEAEFLLSEGGQMRIATCLFKAVKEIYETQNNGLS